MPQALLYILTLCKVFVLSESEKCWLPMDSLAMVSQMICSITGPMNW